MPTLSSKPITFELLEPQFPSSTLTAINAAQEFTKRINDIYVEPMRILSERINEVYFEPMRQLSKTLEIYNSQIIKIVSIASAIDNSIWKSMIIPQPRTLDADIIEAEIEEIKPIQTISSAVPLLGAGTQTKYYENFSIALTIEGRFYYSNTLITSISTNSKHGQLLKFLLEDENNYVTDDFLFEIFKPPDIDKGLGYIRDDLKRYLAKEGLRIELYRNRDKTNRGYKLIKVSRLAN